MESVAIIMKGSPVGCPRQRAVIIVNCKSIKAGTQLRSKFYSLFIKNSTCKESNLRQLLNWQHCWTVKRKP